MLVSLSIISIHFYIVNAFQTFSFHTPQTSHMHVDTLRRNISNKLSVFKDELEEQKQQVSQEQPTRIYFDISIEKSKPIGRLIFNISQSSSFFYQNKHKTLSKYVGVTFNRSIQSVAILNTSLNTHHNLQKDSHNIVGFIHQIQQVDSKSSMLQENLMKNSPSVQIYCVHVHIKYMVASIMD